MHRICAVLLLAFAIGCASDPGTGTTGTAGGPAPVTGAQRYRAEAGPSPVGTIPDVTLHDAQSGRDVVVSIDYPTRSDKNPVILFSHGFGGSNRDYAGLSSFWAGNGYVVLRPRHADSGMLSQAASADEARRSQTPADWAARAADIRFVVDSLAALEQRFPELQGKIDSTRLGIGGHSYGAQTALLIGGAVTVPAINGARDERVRAVVAMSPQGPAPTSGFNQESYRPLALPVLFMTGSRDVGATEEQGPEWRRQAFELSPAGGKWFISINGARHSSFSGRLEEGTELRRTPNGTIRTDPWGRPVMVEEEDQRPGSGRTVWTPERDIFFNVRALTLAFWDGYLKEDEGGRRELEASRQRTGLVVATK